MSEYNNVNDQISEDFILPSEKTLNSLEMNNVGKLQETTERPIYRVGPPINPTPIGDALSTFLILAGTYLFFLFLKKKKKAMV